jgi:hypothetical protein
MMMPRGVSCREISCSGAGMMTQRGVSCREISCRGAGDDDAEGSKLQWGWR